MSVLAKARQFSRGFPAFISTLLRIRSWVSTTSSGLKGYGQKPANMTMAANMQYNEYFPGHAIGMPPPLTDGAVEYTDGAPRTVDQYCQGRCRVPDVGGSSLRSTPASGPGSSF